MAKRQPILPPNHGWRPGKVEEILVTKVATRGDSTTSDTDEHRGGGAVHPGATAVQ